MFKYYFFLFYVPCYVSCVWPIGNQSFHSFLYFLLTLRLWHQLLGLTKMSWDLPRSIGDMVTISLRGLVISIEVRPFNN